MAQNTATVEVEHNGETIDVPTQFERGALAAWFGDVPDSFDVDRIFRFEGGLRAESYLGGGEWVEVVRHTDEHRPTFNAQNDRGWVAEIVNASENGDETGETVWER